MYGVQLCVIVILCVVISSNIMCLTYVYLYVCMCVWYCMCVQYRGLRPVMSTLLPELFACEDHMNSSLLRPSQYVMCCTFHDVCMYVRYTYV